MTVNEEKVSPKAQWGKKLIPSGSEKAFHSNRPTCMNSTSAYSHLYTGYQ